MRFMRFSRRATLRLGAAALGAAAAFGACAQAFPDRPVTIVLAYPAGSVSDVLARSVAQQLGAEWKQPVVVDNRPGGNQIIATTVVAKAPADGYTLLMADDGVFTLNPHLFSKLPYRLGDFAPVVDLAELQMVLSLSKATPAGNVAELVALAKEQPGKLNYGSFGVGNIVHLSMESFQKMAGIKLVHVPYKGYPDAIRDVIANQVQIVLGGVGGPVLQHLKSGAMPAAAPGADLRRGGLPRLQSFRELHPDGAGRHAARRGEPDQRHGGKGGARGNRRLGARAQRHDAPGPQAGRAAQIPGGRPGRLRGNGKQLGREARLRRRQQ